MRSSTSPPRAAAIDLSVSTDGLLLPDSICDTAAGVSPQAAARAEASVLAPYLDGIFSIQETVCDTGRNKFFPAGAKGRLDRVKVTHVFGRPGRIDQPPIFSIRDNGPFRPPVFLDYLDFHRYAPLQDQ